MLIAADQKRYVSVAQAGSSTAVLQSPAMLIRLLRSAALLCALPVHALDGEIAVHDPATVILQAGRYDTYVTGNGLPILRSDDGWPWHRAGSLLASVPGGKP